MEEDMEVREIQEDQRELELSLFNFLPDEILMKVLSYISPYTDTKNAKLVNKKWNHIISSGEQHNRKVFLESIANIDIIWKIRKQRSYDFTETLVPHPCKYRSNYRSKTLRTNPNIPHGRFAHSSAVLGPYMYIFGGSNSESRSSSTFNDLHRLDLSTYTWQKVKTEGLHPAPRECCSMVSYKQKPKPRRYKTIPYKGKIILFGGWCHPLTEIDRMRIGARFFDDTQIFDANTLTWTRLAADIYPTARAGHSASIVGSRMVIFGGSQRNNRLNDVWEFDIENETWSCPHIRGPKPAARFGHSQFTLNQNTIMILGGSGGANPLYGDAWILDTSLWRWSQLNVLNSLHDAPNLWSHAATIIQNNIVVISEDKKCPYCRCPIQNFQIPQSKPEADSKDCSCGRRIPEELIHFTNPKLQLYVLDISKVLTNYSCRWTNYKYLNPSPPSREAFTAVLGINEILIFGGLQNPSSISDDSTISIIAKSL